MKLRKAINLILSLFIFGILVSGFQIEDSNSKTMSSILSLVGIEEAYAGPCGRRGCSKDRDTKL